MDTDSGALAAILLGFLLGLKHATDADHVIAISTVVKEYKNAPSGNRSKLLNYFIKNRLNELMDSIGDF